MNVSFVKVPNASNNSIAIHFEQSTTGAAQEEIHKINALVFEAFRMCDT